MQRTDYRLARPITLIDGRIADGVMSEGKQDFFGKIVGGECAAIVLPYLDHCEKRIPINIPTLDWFIDAIPLNIRPLFVEPADYSFVTDRDVMAYHRTASRIQMEDASWD